MRLSSVWVENFKNLSDVSIDFDHTSPYTVLVGENGAGKSNLIEALTLIFRNLDLDVSAPLTYSLKYQCRGNDIAVDAEVGKFPRFQVRRTGEKSYKDIPRRKFMSEDSAGAPFYRPSFVFGYYSGPSNRLATLYEKHRERFYSRIIKAAERRSMNLQDPNSLRRLFYGQTLHGQFALLAFFMTPETDPGSDRAFLREHLQIDSLDSVLFALKRPPWRPPKGGDPRFWRAEGEVRKFLGHLYDAALLPMRMDRRIPVDLAKNPSVESLYLFLPSPEALERVYQSYSDQYAFFTALESTHLSKVLAEVRTRVRMTAEGGGGEVTYRDLSEGEQQLLLVLGLLKFTARDEALFLLDEPDTHLNPAWSTQYLQFLDRFIGMRDRKNSCHIVMSSHDPLVFAGLERAQVRIFRRNEAGRVVVEIPDLDPRGMGVAAILTSDLFRLRSTLDPYTQRELDRQRLLAQRELTVEEQEELRKLNISIRRKGLSQTTRDPLYELFIRSWTQREDPTWAEAVELTAEQMQDRARLADEILAEILLSEEGSSEIYRS